MPQLLQLAYPGQFLPLLLGDTGQLHITRLNRSRTTRPLGFTRVLLCWGFPLRMTGRVLGISALAYLYVIRPAVSVCIR
ncbi:hypothetical protein QT17_09815 [Thermus sp. 2.9]|nr:hypothetical protein QT17_09815 [Thermus sp. 2.9]